MFYDTTACFITDPLNSWDTLAFVDTKLQTVFICYESSSTLAAISCAMLTELHQKTLYISPSVLTNISELGEGIHVYACEKKDVMMVTLLWLSQLHVLGLSVAMLILQPVNLNYK